MDPSRRHRPVTRQGLALAYDSDRERIVLFGGASGSSKLRDTWEWDGDDWTQVQNAGPQGRANHAMAFDSSKNRVVMFGGESSRGLLGDTWEWDGEEWTQQQDIGPSPRKGHAMVSNGSSMILFGGADRSGTGLGDTWEWDGQEWTQRQDIGPDASVHASMVFTDPSIILFGGIDSIDESVQPEAHTIFGNTWEWNGQRWTQVQDIGPQARWLHATAFDRTAGKVILFGGLSSFAPVGDPSLRDATVGRHLEHEAEAGSSPPSPPRSEIEFSDVTLNPSTLNGPGESSILTFTLSESPTNSITVVSGAFDQTGNPIQPEQLSVAPFTAQVDPGQTSGQFTFTRGTAPLDPGRYLILVALAEDVTGTQRVVELEVLS